MGDRLKAVPDPVRPLTGHLGTSEPDHAPSSASLTSQDERSTTNPTDLFGDNPPQANKNKLAGSSKDDSPEQRPPLPPRPGTARRDPSSHTPPPSALSTPSRSSRPQLHTKPTTAVSLTDIQSYQDGTRETASIASIRARNGLSPDRANNGPGIFDRYWSRAPSEAGETSSIRSFALTNVEPAGDVESLLGEVLGAGEDSGAWKHFDVSDLDARQNPAGPEDDRLEELFNHEFDEFQQVAENGANEDVLLREWSSRLKHFLILSSAGKPIYSRHGEPNLISHHIGIIQTIISFYQDSDDALKSFSAGDARFVISTEGPLYLVAISRLQESDSQLRVQLDALYMQILSTLTLPTLTQLFTNRPSTDLRRPLQGTEPLLSALADSFTKGSIPTLLSSLECLKVRKAHRYVINNTLLKSRAPDLLYGMIVAGGRLVSVVRPKRHSLHPGDLHLIFNMLFEAGGVKAGGGENWIPLCLPGFNKNGYLYMYVSFLTSHPDDARGPSQDRGHRDPDEGKESQVAIVLISANKEGFYDLQKMSETVVRNLANNGSMEIIRSAVQKGRPSATDIMPGTVIRHFLCKSRANIQFVMPSFAPHFNTLFQRRKLLTTYHTLHANLHAKNAHLKIQHVHSLDAVSLGWITPTYELYAVGGANATRAALAKSAERVLQWAKREEERLFIIGGAVF